MRPRNILRKSQQLLRNSAHLHPILSSKTRPCLPQKSSYVASNKSSFRKMSSVVESSVSPGAGELPAPPGLPENTDPEQSREASIRGSEAAPMDHLPTKLKVRRTRTTTISKEAETVELPDDLDIFLWPQPSDALSKSALPSPEVLEEALNKLLITQHPHIQHQATYPTGPDPPVEPTLALYCPIEGGEYIIDATVRELANSIGAEVLVLDSVQLAGGECGKFGKAASSLQLPVNPLHFPSSQEASQRTSEENELEEDDDDDGPHQLMALTTLLARAHTRRLTTTSSRRASTRSQIKGFFDAVVNSPSSESSTISHPRIIYIRDFSILAPSSSIWYPPLLSAVRQRRKGPISRPTSPISHPITIIFGMTPSLTPPVSNGVEPNNFVGYLMNQNSSLPIAPHESKSERLDWSESDSAEKARERRLQDRLRKWEKHELALFSELPKLSTASEDEPSDSQKPEIIILGSGSRGLPGMPSFSGQQTDLRGARGGESEKKSSFFRASVLVPAKRSRSRERATRMARRREINELSMRMGISLVGGRVEDVPACDFFEAVTEEAAAKAGEPAEVAEAAKMWDHWGNRIEVWLNVKKIADSAVGRSLSTPTPTLSPERSLEPTVVPWDSVQSAWAARKAFQDHKRNWLKDAGSLAVGLEETEGPIAEAPTDEIVERIRNDSELDAYEQRLLGCIVDAGSMPTSFSQVHLPSHTIDSVRTIVSLPLLHPQAFQHGILKQHSMSGCLLFGPPGTGKTLVVRALAKDAGCRMLAVTPSDIMDMYVGEAEKLVRAVFSLARRLSPCVVFLDEIDALFGARMSARESGGAAAAHRGVITEFMQEMDGLKSSKEDGIVVIGATNRPFDLDDAVLRRLPRRLLVDLPGEKEREGILQILLRDERLAPDVTPHMLAKRTESFSGSDLKHLCVSAALDAVKERFSVPWKPNLTENSTNNSTVVSALSNETVSQAVQGPVTEAPQSLVVQERVLHFRHFTKALKEITPSSSESLGSLSDLRKWNDEFGEGRKDKKRSPWGKGLFGFVEAQKVAESIERKVEAAVSNSSTSSLEPLY